MIKENILKEKSTSLQKVKLKIPNEEFILKASKIFKVISDPTRMKILNILSEKELCVNEISSLLNISQSAVSHQLILLKSMNLVKYKRKGKKIYYSLIDEHVVKLIKMILEHAKEI